MSSMKLIDSLRLNFTGINIAQKIELATSTKTSAAQHWAIIKEIVHGINESNDGGEQIVQAIIDHLRHQTDTANDAKAFSTLTLLGICVKGCDNRFHLHILRREFVIELLQIVQDAPTNVQELVFCLIRAWAIDFRDYPEEFSGACTVYDTLEKQKGVNFSNIDEIDFEIELLHLEVEGVVEILKETLTKLEAENSDEVTQIAKEAGRICAGLQLKIADVLSTTDAERATNTLLSMNRTLNGILQQYMQYQSAVEDQPVQPQIQITRRNSKNKNRKLRFELASEGKQLMLSDTLSTVHESVDEESIENANSKTTPALQSVPQDQPVVTKIEPEPTAVPILSSSGDMHESKLLSAPVKSNDSTASVAPKPPPRRSRKAKLPPKPAALQKNPPSAAVPANASSVAEATKPMHNQSVNANVQPVQSMVADNSTSEDSKPAAAVKKSTTDSQTASVLNEAPTTSKKPPVAVRRTQSAVKQPESNSLSTPAVSPIEHPVDPMQQPRSMTSNDALKSYSDASARSTAAAQALAALIKPSADSQLKEDEHSQSKKTKTSLASQALSMLKTTPPLLPDSTVGQRERVHPVKSISRTESADSDGDNEDAPPDEPIPFRRARTQMSFYSSTINVVLSTLGNQKSLKQTVKNTEPVETASTAKFFSGFFSRAQAAVSRQKQSQAKDNTTVSERKSIPATPPPPPPADLLRSTSSKKPDSAVLESVASPERRDLMSAIRQGKTLKKVDDKTQSDSTATVKKKPATRTSTLLKQSPVTTTSANKRSPTTPQPADMLESLRAKIRHRREVSGEDSDDNDSDNGNTDEWL